MVQPLLSFHGQRSFCNIIFKSTLILSNIYSTNKVHYKILEIDMGPDGRQVHECLVETLLKHLHKYKDIGFESQYLELKGKNILSLKSIWICVGSNTFDYHLRSNSPHCFHWWLKLCLGVGTSRRWKIEVDREA